MAGGAPQDDPTIPDNGILWRQIPRSWVTHDENRGGWRPSSAAFRDPDLSVILADPSRNPDTAVLPYGFLASVSVAQVRSHGFALVREPEPNEPAHCVVHGKKKGKADRALAEAAIWVIAPPPDFSLDG